MGTRRVAGASHRRRAQIRVITEPSLIERIYVVIGILAIGWTMGTVVSVLGVFLSVVLDLPTGATMVWLSAWCGWRSQS